MNYRRSEMERRLPQASPLLCSFLWTRLNEVGMRLPQEDITFLARIFGDYVQNTKEGKKTIMKMLGATVTPANVKDTFYPQGRRGMVGQELKPQDLQRFSGWLYKEVVPISDNQIEKVEGGNLEACESTGILGPKGYCVQTVNVVGSGGRESLSNLSNYARMFSEDQRVRDTASSKTCQLCPVDSCDYHPSRNNESQQMKLLPMRSVNG